MNNYNIVVLFVILLAFIYSCKDANHSQSSVNNADSETIFAKKLYGNDGSIIAKGDLLGNSKNSAIAAIVLKKTENSFLIKKACLFEQNNNNWNILLNIEDDITAGNGDLLNSSNAKYGYILKIDSAAKPIIIRLFIANEYGKASSDEAILKFNPLINNFEFFTEEIPSNP
jgi:hypothetical protein